MTWTYDVTALDDNPVYRVRFLIGDTDSAAPLVQDEEITFAISQETSEYGAAARCCESVARNMLRRANVRIGRGGTSLEWTTAAQQYTEMALAFRKRANAMNAPWAGGREIAEKVALAQDDSVVQPIFTKTGGDNPWVGGQTLSPTDDGQLENR